MSKLDDRLIAMGIAVCAFVLGSIFGDMVADSACQQAAIEHKAAQYNPVTGEFEWLEVDE